MGSTLRCKINNNSPTRSNRGRCNNRRNSDRIYRVLSVSDFKAFYVKNYLLFLGGLNCSMGLAFGMAQIANMGSVGVKYLLLATKFILNRIFNTKNVTVPLSYASSMILGNKKSPTDKLLEEAWKS